MLEWVENKPLQIAIPTREFVYLHRQDRCQVPNMNFRPCGNEPFWMTLLNSFNKSSD